MWLLIGLILGAALLWLVLWLHQRRIQVVWYEWFISSLGLLLLLFTIRNFSESMSEYETVAAWNSLLVFGLPAVVLMASSFFLVWRRYRRLKAGNQ